jgi:hypothetical protein
MRHIEFGVSAPQGLTWCRISSIGDKVHLAKSEPWQTDTLCGKQGFGIGDLEFMSGNLCTQCEKVAGMTPESKRNTWTSDYRDDQRAALYAVLDDVNVDHGEFLELEFGNESVVLVPLDPEGKWEFHVDFFFSTTREQYKAKITRVPHVREETED